MDGSEVAWGAALGGTARAVWKDRKSWQIAWCELRHWERGSITDRKETVRNSLGGLRWEKTSMQRGRRI